LIVTFTELLFPHKPVPAVPAAVAPQADVSTYRASMEYVFGAVGMVGDAEKGPLLILYSTVNPDKDKSVTIGSVKATAHVFAGAAITGAEGNITTLTVLLLAQGAEPAAPDKVPPQSAART
jgi:hypothetical protein